MVARASNGGRAAPDGGTWALDAYPSEISPSGPVSSVSLLEAIRSANSIASSTQPAPGSNTLTRRSPRPADRADRTGDFNRLLDHSLAAADSTAGAAHQAAKTAAVAADTGTAAFATEAKTAYAGSSGGQTAYAVGHTVQVTAEAAPRRPQYIAD